MEFECDRSAKANATAKVRTPRTSEVSKENRGAVRRTVASYVDLLFLQVSVVISRGCGRRCPCTAKYADKFCIVALNREGIGTAGATLLDRRNTEPSQILEHQRHPHWPWRSEMWSKSATYFTAITIGGLVGGGAGAVEGAGGGA